MENEITVVPLVDILSKHAQRRVVMSGDKYVYFDTKKELSSTALRTAIDEQVKLKIKAQEEKEFKTWKVTKLKEDEARQYTSFLSQKK